MQVFLCRCFVSYSALRRWLYTLFIMVDANFRAKLKDRGLEDAELGPGWSHYVENSKFKAHVDSLGRQTNVSSEAGVARLCTDSVSTRRRAPAQRNTRLSKMRISAGMAISHPELGQCSALGMLWCGRPPSAIFPTARSKYLQAPALPVPC